MCVKETIESVRDIFGWYSDCIKSALKNTEIIVTVIVAIVLGLLFGAIFWLCGLEMSKDAWFYVFSTLSQTLAAFIAFGAMIIIRSLGSEDDKDERGKLIRKLDVPYSLIVTSIVLSIILLTFGQINCPPNWINNDLFKFLKHSVSFFTIALGILGMIRVPRGMIW